MLKQLRAHQRQFLAVLIVALSGWCFLGFYTLRTKSTDCFVRLKALLSSSHRKSTDLVRIVFLDVATITNAEPYVRILENLASLEAQAVIFDIVFTNRFWETDRSKTDFAKAFHSVVNKGVKVIFAAQGLESGSDEEPTREITPTSWIVDMVDAPDTRQNAAIGLSDLARQRADGVVRRYSLASRYAHEPLAVAVASLAYGIEGDQKTHWLNYYGPPGTFRAVGLGDIISSRPELSSLFAGKVVFVGQGPPSTSGQSTLDQHKTPFARWPGGLSSGAEIQATAFCNLRKNEWLREPLNLLDWLLVLGVAIPSGIYATRRPLRKVVLVAVAIALLVCLSSFLLFVFTDYILPWPVMAGPQMVAASLVTLIPVKTVFISYRRADGRSVAVFIANELNRMGIEAFLDVKDHTPGRLDAILFWQIQQRHNFVLILTPGMIERWKFGKGVDNDWIGQEIERAITFRKTVIPVTIDDIGRFIETYRTSSNKPFPPEVDRVLANYKRTGYSSDQPDASVMNIANSLRASVRKT